MAVSRRGLFGLLAGAAAFPNAKVAGPQGPFFNDFTTQHRDWTQQGGWTVTREGGWTVTRVVNTPHQLSFRVPVKWL